MSPFDRTDRWLLGEIKSS